MIKERLMTHGNQDAESRFHVDLNGEDSSANVISRSVARDHSHQLYISNITGNSRCSGHTECDAIIMDEARIQAVPELTANNIDAAYPRGGYRQDSGGAADQADDSGPDGGRGRGSDRKRVLKIGKQPGTHGKEECHASSFFWLDATD
mgnify:CR=1 FL=1